MTGFLIRWAVSALALWVATRIIPGIVFDGGPWNLFLVALLFGVLNAVVRPILKFFSIPALIVTLGLFIFVLNALCFWLVSAVVPGYHVAGFWPALGGALVVSVMSWVATAFVSDRGRVVVITRRG